MASGILDPLLPTTNINNLEQLKFRVDPDDPNSVIVKSSVSGTITPSGLRTAGSFIEISINSTTWTLVTVTSLLRNHIWLQNQSDVQMKINPANTDPGYVGIILDVGQSANMDIQDDISMYVKSESGTGKVLGRLELA
jgi:hypothetical protein